VGPPDPRSVFFATAQVPVDRLRYHDAENKYDIRRRSCGRTRPYCAHFLPDGKGESDHLGETVVRDIVVEVAKETGIQQSYGTDCLRRTQYLVTPHALQATFAVQCVKNQIPAPMVKEALGHHSLNVTDIYTSVIDDDAADMIRRDGPSY
jgi:integrase